MRIVPGYLPDTGATLTTALMHRIVDEATVTLGVVAPVTVAGIVAGSSYTAVLPSLQVLNGNTAVFVAETAASFYPNSLSVNIGAGNDMIVLWTKRSGPGTQVLPVGWPARIPRNDQVFADSSTYKGTQIAGFNYIPWVTGDPRLTDPKWGFSTFDVLTGFPATINLQAITNSGYGVVRTIGMVDALVHYSLSSSFSPGDIYALYHSNSDIGIAQPTVIPISWHASKYSGVTMPFVPYGLIRQVYTASGTTSIAMPQESTAYSLGPQPFYVARVWFWGRPCL